MLFSSISRLAVVCSSLSFSRSLLCARSFVKCAIHCLNESFFRLARIDSLVREEIVQRCSIICVAVSFAVKLLL